METTDHLQPLHEYQNLPWITLNALELLQQNNITSLEIPQRLLGFSWNVPELNLLLPPGNP